MVLLIPVASYSSDALNPECLRSGVTAMLQWSYSGVAVV
jgi:hypothetical protein